MIIRREEPSKDESLDEINQKLAEESLRHNLAPDPEMGGLNPEQVSLLIYLPWQSDEFPMQMNDNLPLHSCERSRLFRNCRKLMVAIQSADGVKSTPAGNFTRPFVAQLTESLELDEVDLGFTRQYRKVINEEDIWDLHLLRIISQSAKLIRRHKGKFHVQKKAVKLLDDQHAGKLYKQLFIGLFTHFNLAYIDNTVPCNSIQQTIPYTLYCLSKLDRDKWNSVKDLPAMTLLPAILDDVETECADTDPDSTAEILSKRVFEPLVDLGLLEGKLRKILLGFHELESIKPSTLFNDFLSFADLP
jgi:hypothetical protein